MGREGVRGVWWGEGGVGVSGRVGVWVGRELR